MNKHTLGPWRLEVWRDCCDEFECWLEPIKLHIHDKISDADANLIAAAPELYEALWEILDSKNDDEEAKAIKKGMYALAKAKGESNDPHN